MRIPLVIVGTTIALVFTFSAPSALAAPSSSAAGAVDGFSSSETVVAAAHTEAVDAARTASGRGIADPSITNRFGVSTATGG